MRTHTMHIRPEGLFYCTLLERLSQKHARYDEVRQRALYYTNGFAREQDVLSIMEHHPRRMSVANVMVNDGVDRYRIDHLLMFQTFSLILDVSYVDVPITASEDGELIQYRDRRSLGNPLRDVKRKAEAFRRLADEQGWSVPPIRSKVLFVHAEDIFEDSEALPDGYTGTLELAEELVDGVRGQGDSRAREAHRKTVNDMSAFILNSPADYTHGSMWRDPAFSDIVNTGTAGPRSGYDPFEDLRDTLLDMLILQGDVMTEGEVERFIGVYSLAPDEELVVRDLFSGMRATDDGDYVLTESFTLSYNLITRLDVLKRDVADRIYDDVTV